MKEDVFELLLVTRMNVGVFVPEQFVAFVC